MGLKLFDAAEDGAGDISKIEIDQEYARRFEHNKKREDLHRLQELQKKGVIDDEESSSSDEESEDSDEIGPSKEDLEFFDALIKVKKQDPILKEKDVALFKSDEEGDEVEAGGESKKKKGKGKMYLKDVVAKQLIEDGPEFDDDDDNGGEATRKKTYNEEQEELKRAFLDAAEAAGSGEEDGGFLSVREREEGGEGGDAGASEFLEKVDEYFGDEKGLDDNQSFLRKYFLDKMWIDKDKTNKRPVDKELLDELSNDEEEVEKQEDYETNFRHEELEDSHVWGHSRSTEGSVRNKDSKRKRQRQSKEERKKIAEMERKEELKHLKNLKREEINEKLKKFKEIAGIADDEDCLVAGDDLEDEFDPVEYDRMMKKVFDDKYYGAEDVDPEFGSDGDEDGDIEKPDFDKEDELLGLPKGWDASGSGDGFLAARERVLKQKAEMGDDGSTGAGEDEEDEAGDDGVDGDDGETVAPEDGKRKRKRKLSLVQKAKEALMEEYYKLDYEDTIGDVKTRFKYANTKPNRYGLSTDEIIMMDDKELNQYVSLKRMAPYRESEWKVPNSQRYQFKMKKKELLGAGPSKKPKHDKRKRPRDDAGTSTAVADDGKASANASNEDTSNLSRKAKRRRRQAELKLSHQRLLAYGKVSSKSKGKSEK